MSIFIKKDDTWKNSSLFYFKINNAYSQIRRGYIMVLGVWKKFYEFVSNIIYIHATTISETVETTTPLQSQIISIHSLRLYSDLYTGSAIRVRRSVDDEQLDIGFVNSALDTTSIISHCGTGSGYVSIWYDQSGNNYIATQSITTQQPAIMITGSICLQNFQPTIRFDGINDYFHISGSNIMKDSYNIHIISTNYGTGGGSAGRSFIMQSTSTASNVYTPSIGWGTGVYLKKLGIYQGGAPESVHFYSNNTYQYNTQLYISVFVDKLVRVALYINGSYDGGQLHTNGFDTTGLNIGTYRLADNRWFGGDIQQIVICNGI